MIHIEITQDGKSILSEDYEESQVRLEERRAVSALFREGEKEAHEIVPSRYCQRIIIAETEEDGVHGTRTDDRDDVVIISQIPTLTRELKCVNKPRCDWHKKHGKQ